MANGVTVHVTESVPILRRSTEPDFMVEHFQTMINIFLGHADPGATPIPKLVVDGVFGPKTEQAVKSFQRNSSSLLQDGEGVVGKLTWTEVLHQWLTSEGPD